MSTDPRARRARIVGVAIALGALFAPILARADANVGAPLNTTPQAPSYIAMDSAAHLQTRLRQLVGPVEAMAGPPAPPALSDGGAFCAPFDVFEMQRKTHLLWPVLARLPRRTLVPALLNQVRSCGYSEGAAKRAGFVLDYLYWNRLADTTGYEVADLLMIRDLLYELSINQHAARLLAAAEVANDVHPPDIFDAPPMKRIRPFHAVGSWPLALTPSGGRAFDDLVSIVDFREGYLLPFRGSLMRVLESEEDLSLLFAFYDYLLFVRSSPQLLAEPHGGWHALMRLSGDQPARAFRVLGVLSSLLYLPLVELGPALAARKLLTPSRLRAMYAGSMAYYLVNELDERAGRVSARIPHEVMFDFFYPDAYSTTNWKWYHYFNNAYLGCELTRRGHSSLIVQAAAKALAALYEGITLHIAIPSRHTIDLDPRVSPLIEAVDDIAINEEGAAFGAGVCK